MSVINKVDLSKPLENFATQQGKQLFEWAEQTWRGFLEQILQLMEGDDISDQDFTMMCDRLARVHSAQCPARHAEMLKDWAKLARFPLSDIKAWEAGENLPVIAKREEIVRQMLQRLIEHIRTVDANVFVVTMIRLVNLQDLRNPKAFTSVAPQYTFRRSIHRLGLARELSDVLYHNNIKTLGDLHSFVEPPIPGGLMISRKRPSQPEFDPVKKLQRLEGIDEEGAKQIFETAKQWDGIWSPSRLIV